MPWLRKTEEEILCQKKKLRKHARVFYSFIWLFWAIGFAFMLFQYGFSLPALLLYLVMLGVFALVIMLGRQFGKKYITAQRNDKIIEILSMYVGRQRMLVAGIDWTGDYAIFKKNKNMLCTKCFAVLSVTKEMTCPKCGGSCEDPSRWKWVDIEETASRITQ